MPRNGLEARDDIAARISDLGMVIRPFDEAQARRAVLAWRQFGKGNHPAALNVGDLSSYSLSAERREPLLFKGEDFGRSDCEAVAW